MHNRVRLFVAAILISTVIISCNMSHVFAPAASLKPLATNTPVDPIIASTSTNCLSGGRIYNQKLPFVDIASSLDSHNCSDKWQLNLPQGAELLITMMTFSGNFSPHFSLWTTASADCQSCNDTTKLQESSSSSSRASMDFVLPYAGDYYVLVELPAGVNRGDYKLSIMDKLLATETPIPTNTSVPTFRATRAPVYPTTTQSNGPNLGTVPVTFTNNTSHRMKIVAVGPLTYSFFIDGGGTTLNLNWAPGTYDVTAYYEDGTYYASTTYAVNENHALFTLN